jgi:hypothetical protein
MALSPKQRADLLALALGEPPASAPVAGAVVAKPSITPTQLEPKPAAEAAVRAPVHGDQGFRLEGCGSGCRACRP